MGDYHADAIRRVYKRWETGDFRALELFDPDVVFVMRPGFPDSGVYNGVAEVAEYMRHLLEPWERLTIAAERIDTLGDSVVAAIVQRGAGRESGIDTEFRYWQVWSFRGDRVIRWESVRERDVAFALVTPSAPPSPAG